MEFLELFTRPLKDKPSKIPPMSAIGRRRSKLDCSGALTTSGFLDVVGNNPGTLLALDFEPNPTGPSMDLEEARAFVTHIYEERMRFPGFYSGHYIKQLLWTSTDPILAGCWFWLAQYGPTPVVPRNWKTWTMWQYTDGAVGPKPHTVKGIGRCDRDKFNGSEAQLRKLWGPSAPGV